MITSITPIQTKYKGYSFRSRLEARWAVFFDHLGVKWDYEPEGYQLSNGVWYLPDFYLPDLKTHAEVKPAFDSYADVGGFESTDDYKKVAQFVDDSSGQVWLLDGVPSMRAYSMVFHFDRREPRQMYWRQQAAKNPNDGGVAYELKMAFEEPSLNVEMNDAVLADGRFVYEPYLVGCGDPQVLQWGPAVRLGGGPWEKAVEAARSARFGNG